MDRELERLKADRDATREQANIDDKVAGLQHQIVEQERIERRYGSANGDSPKGLQASITKVALREQLIMLEASQEARAAAKEAATAALRGALNSRHRERVEAVELVIQKGLADCYRLLDSLEAQRIEDRREFEVSVDANNESPLLAALRVIWEGPLRQAPWLSPAARAEAEKTAKVVQGPKLEERQRRYDEKVERLNSLVSRGKLSRDERDKALAATREMLGVK